VTTAVVEGLGTALPARRVTNDDLARVLDTSDEWIRTRTGIVARRMVDEGTVTGDLAVEAGERALKSAGGGGADAVVIATTTPDQLLPNTAAGVADRLGLGHVAALDLNTACAGFPYGLATGAGLLAIGAASRVLVIGAETLTRFLDPADRSTAVLFGDGAGAFVLGRGEADAPGALGPFELGSDGSASEILTLTAGGSRRPPHSTDLTDDEKYLKMDGREVYRHAVRRMAESLTTLAERAGMTVGDFDAVYAHQANSRIIEAVADRLELPRERCPVTIGEHANTSTASIPLALASAPPNPGDRVALVAFGGGLAWGSALVRWPDLEPG